MRCELRFASHLLLLTLLPATVAHAGPSLRAEGVESPSIAVVAEGSPVDLSKLFVLAEPAAGSLASLDVALDAARPIPEIPVPPALVPLAAGLALVARKVIAAGSRRPN